jgi:DHA2 family multidrug resistance protein
MGNATSLFNLMRNIGGSIGIAVTGTMVARHQQVNIAIMGSHVTAMDPEAQTMFAQLRAGFIAAGSDLVTATNRAYGALFGLVQQQAAIVSFVGLFELLGFIFFALLPLVLLMKRPRTGAGPMAAH